MSDATDKPRHMRFDMTINLPTLIALATVALSAYTMYLREIQEIRAENIRQDGRGAIVETAIRAMSDRISAVEAAQLASRTDRDLLIRIDQKIQVLERAINRDQRP